MALSERMIWDSDMSDDELEELEETVDDMYRQADRTDRPIQILLECYQKYEEPDSFADQIANDREALQWLNDYWAFVCWMERGNQASVSEVGGFVGFAPCMRARDLEVRACGEVCTHSNSFK